MNVFSTVDHELVAVASGGRAQRAQVAAGARFGEHDGSDHLAARHLGQPRMFLSFGAVGEYVLGHDLAVGPESRAGQTEAGLLLDDDGGGQAIASTAAVFDGHVDAEVAEFAGS